MSRIIAVAENDYLRLFPTFDGWN